MRELAEQIDQAAGLIRDHWSGTPRVGLILGTGLGGLTDQFDVQATIPYAEIPCFPESTAPSHAGQLVCGTLGTTSTLAMEGRFHYYEGYPLKDVTFPVRVMKALGIDILIVTSAVGGMNPQYQLADVLIVEDHINLMPDNPLRGVNNDALGPRFPDMSEPYDRELIRLARQTALELAIAAHTGVLAAVPGPNLETRAEYRMLRAIGADAVGMSTVPECIVARHAGLRVLAFSIITDICLPDALEPADVETIIEIASQGGKDLARLIPAILERI